VSYHECPGSGIGEDTGGGDCEWEADFNEALQSWVSEKYGKPMRTYAVGLRITCRRCGLRMNGELSTQKPEMEA
jgi:hypothetical protein